MNLKITVATVIIVGAATFAWLQVSKSQFSHSAEGIRDAEMAYQRKQYNHDLQERVTKLSADRCEKVTMDLIHTNEMKSISGSSDIEPQLLSDLRLCSNRGIMSPFARDRLNDVGLMKYASVPVS